MARTADTRSPGSWRPDVGTTPLGQHELSARDYYAGLSTWDSYRVSLFVHMIRRAGEKTPWQYGVTAYQPKSNELNLSVLTSATRDRSEALHHVREEIRKHYQRLHVPIDEGAEEGGRTAFLVGVDSEEAKGKTLYVQIDGSNDPNFLTRINSERHGDKPFTVLLEPVSQPTS